MSQCIGTVLKDYVNQPLLGVSVIKAQIQPIDYDYNQTKKLLYEDRVDVYHQEVIHRCIPASGGKVPTGITIKFEQLHHVPRIEAWRKVLVWQAAVVLKAEVRTRYTLCFYS
jgi:hypothetical protein